MRVCRQCGRHLPKGMDVCIFCVKKSALFTRTLRLMKPYAGRIIAAGLILTLSTALSALLPVFNARLVDVYFTDESLAQADAIRGILITVGFICLTQVAGGLTHMII